MTLRSRRGLVRWTVALATICVGAVALSACGESNDDAATGPEPGEPIKVGLNMELSGPGEFFGNSRLIAAKVARDQINDDGGIEVDGESYPLELVVCDNRTDATQGVRCAEEAVDEDVLWTVAPDPGFAAAYDIYRNENIISIANGGEAGAILDENAADHPLLFFEFLTFDQYFGEAQLSQLRALHPEAKSIAALVPDDAQGQAVAAAFEAHAEEYGFEYLGEERHPVDATGDFTGFLTSLKGLNPDIVFLSYFPEVTVPSIEQAAQLDVAPVFTTSLLSPALVGDISFEGHSLVSFQSAWAFGPGITPQEDPGSTGAQEVIDAMDREAGNQPYLSSIATEAYVGSFQLVKEAIEAADSLDPEDIAPALTEATYDGPLGPSQVVEETHSADNAENTLVFDEQGNLSVAVFNSGFDDEPAYTFEVNTK